jgi:hypothetical protein
MSLMVFLDTGPLGILTNPTRPSETVCALMWVITMLWAGHRFVVPVALFVSAARWENIAP